MITHHEKLDPKRRHKWHRLYAALDRLTVDGEPLAVRLNDGAFITKARQAVYRHRPRSGDDTEWTWVTRAEGATLYVYKLSLP